MALRKVSCEDNFYAKNSACVRVYRKEMNFSDVLK